jgi:hypothetical protein
MLDRLSMLPVSSNTRRRVDIDLVPDPILKLQIIDFRSRTGENALSLITAIGNVPAAASPPDPPPEPPPMPTIDFGSIRNRLEAQSLSVAEQHELVTELLLQADDVEQREAIALLTAQLRQHPDLTQRIRADLDILQARLDASALVDSAAYEGDRAPVEPPPLQPHHSTPKGPAPVFFSYASEDVDQVEPFAARLEAETGLSVWWDRQIPLGQTWDDTIEEALGAARCVVVLWSANARKSEWVRAEATDAAERGVLLQAFLDDVKPPLRFRMFEGAHLVDNDENEWKALVAAVRARAEG